jgi:hypothetical protein
METGIILIIAGVWFIVQAFIITTKNTRSILYFKVFPFFIGLACLWAGSKWFGWI